MATACLFLACKVEECLRRVQKVLEMCYAVRYKMDLNDVRQAFQDNKVVASPQLFALLIWAIPACVPLTPFLPALPSRTCTRC